MAKRRIALTVRVDQQLYKKFHAYTENNDKVKNRVIYRLIKDYVDEKANSELTRPDVT